MRVVVNLAQSFVEVEGFKRNLGKEGLAFFPKLDMYVEVYQFKAPQRNVVQVTTCGTLKVGNMTLPDYANGNLVDHENLQICYQ